MYRQSGRRHHGRSGTAALRRGLQGPWTAASGQDLRRTGYRTCSPLAEGAPMSRQRVRMRSFSATAREDPCRRPCGASDRITRTLGWRAPCARVQAARSAPERGSKYLRLTCPSSDAPISRLQLPKCRSMNFGEEGPIRVCFGHLNMRLEGIKDPPEMTVGNLLMLGGQAGQEKAKLLHAGRSTPNGTYRASRAGAVKQEPNGRKLHEKQPTRKEVNSCRTVLRFTREHLTCRFLAGAPLSAAGYTS